MSHTGHVFGAVLVLGIVCCVAAAGDPEIPRYDFSDATAYAVIRVVDGNAVVIQGKDEEVTVRLVGVDAPESGAPGGPAATEFVKNLLTGESVYILPDSAAGRQDSYGRNLDYLFRAPDGLSVNLELVRQGYARVHTGNQFDQRELFDFYGKRAQDAGKGLWAEAQEPRGGAVPAVIGTARAAVSQGKSTAGPTTKAEPAAKVQVAPKEPGDVTVYITKTGKKYHTAGCRFLKSSKIPISLPEAKAKGYTPCGVCGPPD